MSGAGNSSEEIISQTQKMKTERNRVPVCAMCSVSILSTAHSQLELQPNGWVSFLFLSPLILHPAYRHTHTHADVHVHNAVNTADTHSSVHSSKMCIYACILYTGFYSKQKATSLLKDRKPMTKLWGRRITLTTKSVVSYPVAHASWPFDYISILGLLWGCACKRRIRCLCLSVWEDDAECDTLSL